MGIITIFGSIKQSPRLVLATAILMVLLINVIDRLTGPELSTSIFYLFPMGMVAWYINRRFGFYFAFASAALWLITDLTTNPNAAHPLIPYWNALVRLGFFLIVVWSLASLRRTREKENEIMGFVVHDLRSPLSNTLAALEMLEEESDTEASSFFKELVEVASSSSKQMLILVNTLLDLSQLEGGKMPVHLESVNIVELFSKAAKQIRIMVEYKNITLVAKNTSMGVFVMADVSLAERVLVNLLSNAIKFAPAEGHITFSAEIWPDNQVLIGIQDDGPGIPVELEKHVFSRFGQATSINSGAHVGSGLGLTFCKLAIEAQNGRIWLEPTPGKGTLIHFVLPGG